MKEKGWQQRAGRARSCSVQATQQRFSNRTETRKRTSVQKVSRGHCCAASHSQPSYSKGMPLVCGEMLSKSDSPTRRTWRTHGPRSTRTAVGVFRIPMCTVHVSVRAFMSWEHSGLGASHPRIKNDLSADVGVPQQGVLGPSIYLSPQGPYQVPARNESIYI